MHPYRSSVSAPLTSCFTRICNFLVRVCVNFRMQHVPLDPGLRVPGQVKDVYLQVKEGTVCCVTFIRVKLQYEPVLPA